MKKTKEKAKYKPFLKGGGRPTDPYERMDRGQPRRDSYESDSDRRREMTHRIVGMAFLVSVIALVLITIFGQYFYNT